MHHHQCLVSQQWLVSKLPIVLMLTTVSNLMRRLSIYRYGLRQDCGQLGPCGQSLQRIFTEFEGNFGVDHGAFSSQIPFGFACEAGPFENATRAQWPLIGGAVKCKTTIIVAKIVSIVFGVCSLLAGVAICFMLFKMLGNYRVSNSDPYESLYGSLYESLYESFYKSLYSVTGSVKKHRFLHHAVSSRGSEWGGVRGRLTNKGLRTAPSVATATTSSIHC